MKTIEPEDAYRVYNFKCPNCGYNILEPDEFSTDWTEYILEDYIAEHGRQITCNFCDTTYKLPAKLLKHGN